MSGLLEGLAGALGGDTVGQLAGLLGADQDATSKAVAVALPALLGGLARNAQSQQGAGALFDALNQDHDGSILGNLGSILGGGAQQEQSVGEKILGHVLGGGRPRVERQVAQSSGLGGGLVAKLLPILAPMVLGYLGRRVKDGSMSQNDLTAELAYERSNVKQNDNVLGGLLDLLDGPDDDDSNGGLMDIAGDLITGPAGRAILGQLLR